jgi:hypothetical protein
MNQPMNDHDHRESPSPRAGRRGMARQAVGVLTLLGLLLTSRAAHAAFTVSLALLDPYTNNPISELCAGQEYKVLEILQDVPSVTVTLESSRDGVTWAGPIDLWNGPFVGEARGTAFFVATSLDNGVRYRARASDGTILSTTGTLTVHAVTVNCPVPINATADAGKCTASGINPTAPSATSDCGSATVTGTRSDNKPLTDPYPAGTTTITWTALTSGGGSASCTQTVTVSGAAEPVFAAPNLRATTDPGKCTASVSFSPTATSTCGTPTVVCKVGENTITSPHTFPVGTTTVHSTATDPAGNTATTSFTITVSDGEKPGFGSATNLNATTDAGKCTASVSFTAPTAADNCGTPLVVCKVGDETITSPHTFPVGTSTVDCTATDAAGNPATTSFTVTVTDGEQPAITCAPSKIVSADAGGCSASLPVDLPTVTDNCPNVAAPTGTRSDGLALDAAYPAGTTTLTWNVTDAAGNSATCKQDVTVKYTWSGVLQPINADGSSVFKAGSTIPVKFSVGCTGSLAATLAWRQVTSGGVGPVNEAASTSAATSGNQFRYDATSGQYLYNWSTKGLTAGTYQLQINLGDGVIRTVNVGLK